MEGEGLVLTGQLGDVMKESAEIALSYVRSHAEALGLSPETAAMTESTEYVGRAVAALAADPNVLEKTGKLLTVVDVAKEYGFTDIDGRQVSLFWQEYLSQP